MEIRTPWQVIAMLLDVTLADSSLLAYITYTTHHKFGDLCSTSVLVATSFTFVVEYTYGSVNCTVRFYTKDEQSTLKAYFLFYDVRKSCSGPINIYNTKNKPLLGESGYCRPLTPKGYYDLGSNGSVALQAGTESIDAVLRVVEFFLNRSSCVPAQFNCDTDDIWIAKDLQCDFYPDCPNGKDEESHCAKAAILHYIFLSATTLALCILCLCWTIFLTEKRKPKKKKPKRPTRLKTIRRPPLINKQISNVTPQQHYCLT